MLWLRGGFPGSYLSLTNDMSVEWRKQYIRTFLEQDIPNLGMQISPMLLRRFWMMLAHYHGNILNVEELSRSLGINNKTIRCNRFDPDNCYFWATHQQAEIDLIVFHQGKRLGFEFKYNDAPKITKSMRIACEDLKLDSLSVIYPGTRRYALTEKINVCPLIIENLNEH